MSENSRPSVAVSWLKQVALVIMATILISVMIIQTYDINDVSMQPTFDRQGNRVIVFLTPYIFGAVPDHGDIVIIDSRVDHERTIADRFNESPLVAIVRRDINEHLWVKRVVGLPGDRLEFKDGKVHRNGEALDEDYILEKMNGSFEAAVVPEGHIYVMGDNRNRSSDSRQIGPVPLSNLQGRVILRFLPFNKMVLY